MAAGNLLPVPHRTYDFTDAKAAFRDLASARHIGKLVLTPATPPRPLVRAEGAYIVTGGAAGLGFATAEWLAEQGARRVILVSRRPPAADIAARIACWREKGVDIAAIQGDIGAPEIVSAVVADAGAALRGVIHCASVHDDAPVVDLTWDRFEKVMLPKAQGAWNLHHATADCTLDFFVLFSSWASIAGTRGGANYAAANVALDSLAHLRRHQGLPARASTGGLGRHRLGGATAGGLPVRPGWCDEAGPGHQRNGVGHPLRPLGTTGNRTDRLVAPDRCIRAPRRLGLVRFRRAAQTSGGPCRLKRAADGR